MKNIILKIILLILCLGQILALSNQAIAQAAEDTAGGSSVSAGPATGTLVAAALETAGYVAQAKMLKDLKDTIKQLGALFYLVCIIAGVFALSLLGSPGTSLWLLVGPPMFFYMINITTKADGVEWALGPFHDRSDLQKTLRGANIPESEGQEVSWFFHHYNVLVSDTLQQLAEFVTKDDVKHQMKFMARQQIIDDLFAADLDSSELLQLAYLSLYQCYDVIDAARRVAIGQRDPTYKESPEYKEAVQYYCENYDRKDREIPTEARLAKEYVERVETVNNGSGGLPANFNTSRISCEQMWNWMYDGISKVSEEDLEYSVAVRVSSQADIKIIEQIKKDIEEKLFQPNAQPVEAFHEVPVQQTFICPGKAAPQIVSRKELIPLIFAGYMLKKVYASDPRGQMIQTLYDRAGIQYASNYRDKYAYKNPEWSQEVSRRFRNENASHSSKYEAYAMAKMLPYVQGAGLYVLSVTFPFFAMLLIIPGKSNNFFTWCALWAWLKSWDLGWAMVMVADELLWVMMPHSAYFRLGQGTPGQANAGVYTDPVTVLEAAFGGDYAYNLSTYYLLLGTMITAVPILSAHAVLGSKRAIAGIFVSGIKTISQFFGQKITDWISVEQLREVDRRREMFPAQKSIKAAQAEHERLMANKNNSGNFLEGVFGKVDRQKFYQGFQKYSANYSIAASPDATDFQRKEATLQASAGLAEMKSAAGEGFDYNTFRSRVTELFSKDSNNPIIRKLAQGNIDVNKLISGDEETLKQLNRMFLEEQKAIEMKDQGQALPETEMHARAIEMMRDQADLRQGIGEIATVLGIGTKIFQVDKLTRKITAGQFDGTSSLINFGTSMQESGLELQRKVTDMSINQIKVVSESAYYEATKESDYYFYENLRAGITYRTEHWGVYKSPYTALLGLDYQWQNAEVEATRSQYTMPVKVFNSVVEGLRK